MKTLENYYPLIPAAIVLGVALFMGWVIVTTPQSKPQVTTTQECVDVTLLEDTNSQLTFGVGMCQDLLRAAQSSKNRCSIREESCQMNLSKCIEGAESDLFPEPF